MKTMLAAAAGSLVLATALADDVSGSERLLCSSSQAMICFETGECFNAQPWELDVPQFILVDLKKDVLSTTGAAEERRSTPISRVTREEGTVFLQGIERRRAFSIVIEESLGTFNAAVARDGVTVSVFGACTDAARIGG
jgi:hypothetical protein